MATKILFITRCYPPATGGMERFANDLHTAVSKKTDMQLLSWGGSKLWLVTVLPYFFVRSFILLLLQKFTIIHAQDGVVSILAVPLKMLFKKPLVVVIHGLDVTFNNKLYQKLIRWSLGHADAVVCISTAAKNEVVKRGIDEAKVQVIPLGITDDLHTSDKNTARKNVQEFVPQISSDTKIIVSSGRLVARKGVDWFIANVMPEIINTFPETMLLISGEGPWREAIERAILQRKLQNNVVLLGRTTDSQLKDLYNSADCFVMPNVTVKGDMEGFGRVLLEAALCEVPVVASGIEGIVDAIVDGQNGTLVGERNTDEFVRAISDIFTKPSTAKSRAGRGREYTLAHYGWPTIADRYLAVYDQLQKDRD